MVPPSCRHVVDRRSEDTEACKRFDAPVVVVAVLPLDLMDLRCCRTDIGELGAPTKVGVDVFGSERAS